MHEFFAYALELQLGIHSKPVYVLNTEGFYNPIKDLISNMIEKEFMPSGEEGLIKFFDTVEELVKELK
jgi:predicted Rossmann-fold nucleotide-binding protein